MKTKIKEITVFVCEMCGEEYISMQNVPEKCKKSTKINFTGGAKVGNAVRSTPFGLECGFKLIGRVLRIHEYGHEIGIVVKNYLRSDSIVYLGEKDCGYWCVLSDAELDAWKKMIDENLKPEVD